jgi:hypothetical protein
MQHEISAFITRPGVKYSVGHEARPERAGWGGSGGSVHGPG